MLIILLIMIGHFQNERILADSHISIFDKAIKLSEGIPVETTVKVKFKADNLDERYYTNMLNKLNIGSFKANEVKNIQGNCLEFNNNIASGYIESMRYDNYNLVTILISVKSTNNLLEELRNKVTEAVGRDIEFIEYFQNIRAKIAIDDLSKINKDLTLLLKGLGVMDIQTVKLQNGYSSVAKTKSYIYKEDSTRGLDFNFALCNYASGNYIILGTPIIITSY